MPFVNVRTVKGIMTAEQKRDLISRITDVMVDVEGKGNPAFRNAVWVMIDEREPEDWGMNGSQLTPAVIEKLAAAGA